MLTSKVSSLPSDVSLEVLKDGIPVSLSYFNYEKIYRIQENTNDYTFYGKYTAILKWSRGSATEVVDLPEELVLPVRITVTQNEIYANFN